MNLTVEKSVRRDWHILGLLKIFFGHRFHQGRVLVDCVRLVSIDLSFGYLDFFHLIFVFKTVLVYCVAHLDYLDLPKLQTALQLPMIKTKDHGIFH